MLKSDGFLYQKATFVTMKRKLQILNAVFGLTVLFAVLFQPLHTIEHLVKIFSEESCIHDYSKGANLNHSHYWEKCQVCDFAFNPTIQIKSVVVYFENPVFYNKIIYFSISENIPFFNGSFFSLRGPPIV
jgi:hypothetical protein